MLTHLLFAAFLLITAALLAARTMHLRRARQNEPVTTAERNYFDRQFRRRSLTNVLIGVVGLMIFAGFWVTKPLAVAMFWSGVLLIVILILGLAAADVVSSQRHFRDLRSYYAVERAKLEAAARRLRSHHGNGSAANDSPLANNDPET